VGELVDATIADGIDTCEGRVTHQIVGCPIIERPDENHLWVPYDDLLEVHRRVHAGEGRHIGASG
jgi:hypothetical protein